MCRWFGLCLDRSSVRGKVRVIDKCDLVRLGLRTSARDKVRVRDKCGG